MLNHAEILLSTVQNLREYLARHPHARGDLETIRGEWLPGELFPPEPDVVRQAVNVLVNAGELIGIAVSELPPSFRVDADRAPAGTKSNGARDSMRTGLAPDSGVDRERRVYCAKDPLDRVAGY